MSLGGGCSGDAGRVKGRRGTVVVMDLGSGARRNTAGGGAEVRLGGGGQGWTGCRGCRHSDRDGDPSGVRARTRSSARRRGRAAPFFARVGGRQDDQDPAVVFCSGSRRSWHSGRSGKRFLW